MKRSLTKLERRYLELLLAATEGVPIEDFLAGQESVNGSNLVAAHIVQLRRKTKGKYEIETVHGWGYQLFLV